MGDQLSLLDLPEPPAPTPFEVGMAASSKAARYRWSPAEIAAVDRAIELCAHFQPEFTADDVWKRLPKDFPVTKGLASRLNVAANRGLIVATDRTRKAGRGGDHDHGQRLTIWRSL